MVDDVRGMRIASPISEAIKEAASDPSMNDALAAMGERAGEFPTEHAMMFAGLAMNPVAREHVNAAMDVHWRENGERLEQLARCATEIVIGSGVHAAIYCAVRCAQGYPKPLVIERSERAGGIFAVSRRPSFFLNSRNRPGPFGSPGESDASLNYLPEAVIQPSGISGSEYQTNADMAWAIRTTLACCAHVATGATAVSVSKDAQGEASVVINNIRGQVMNFARAVQAVGLGQPKYLYPGLRGFSRYLTFGDLMARMDRPFPFQGMKRVAVIGGGDSGRTAIEALIGQGPSGGLSSVALDYPTVDWYGRDLPKTREEWERCNRSRYKGIGRALPREVGQESRVRPRERAESGSETYQAIRINGRTYDHAVDCTGFGSQRLYVDSPRTVRSLTVANGDPSGVILLVGPAASISPSLGELARLPDLAQEKNENLVAIFRYAPRTALAASTEFNSL